MGITATVRREDLIAIRDRLVELLFSALPTFVRDVLLGLLGGTVTALSQGLIDLATVSGYTQVQVIYHSEPPPVPTEDATTTTEAGTGTCPVGVWSFPGFEQWLSSLVNTQGSGLTVTSVSGLVMMTWTAGGLFRVTYSNVVIDYAAEGLGPVILFIDGSAEGPYTVEDNRITFILDPASITFTATLASPAVGEYTFGPDELAYFFAGMNIGDIVSCGGDTMTVHYVESGQTFTLTRLE